MASRRRPASEVMIAVASRALRAAWRAAAACGTVWGSAARISCVRLSRWGMKATGIHASGTRKRRSAIRSSASGSAIVNPPYRAAATLSGWPSRRAARASSSSASMVRRPTAAPSTTPATIAAALEPSPRAEGIMLDTSMRQAAAPGADETRSPSRKARIRRFSPAGSSSRGTPSPRALSTIPTSSPTHSSARSFSERATANESNPLPRLALEAGTSTLATGGIVAEYRSATTSSCPRMAIPTSDRDLRRQSVGSSAGDAETSRMTRTAQSRPDAALPALHRGRAA